MIQIQADYVTSRNAGADGCFQVIGVTEISAGGEKTDLLHLVDQGKHYFSGDEVIRDLSLEPSKVDYEII